MKKKNKILRLEDELYELSTVCESLTDMIHEQTSELKVKENVITLHKKEKKRMNDLTRKLMDEIEDLRESLDLVTKSGKQFSDKYNHSVVFTADLIEQLI